MGDTIYSLQQAVSAIVSSSYFLPVIAALIMAFLGSLFTFCVRRKRGDETSTTRRRKTDVVSPDDRVPETLHSSSDCLATDTTTEERTHGEAGASENGVHPIMSRDDEQTRPPLGTRTQESERDLKETLIEEVPIFKEDDRERDNKTTEETTVERSPEEEEVVMVNGVQEEGDGPMVNGEAKRWSFPPELEDFDLVSTETDPTDLEQIFADDRLVEIYITLEPGAPGLGISIVGGRGSAAGDIPIIIKRVLPNSPAEQDGRLKAGDELVAVNDSLLVGVAKDSAIASLSNLSGNVRLLVLQDD